MHKASIKRYRILFLLASLLIYHGTSAYGPWLNSILQFTSKYAHSFSKKTARVSDWAEKNPLLLFFGISTCLLAGFCWVVCSQNISLRSEQEKFVSSFLETCSSSKSRKILDQAFYLTAPVGIRKSILDKYRDKKVSTLTTEERLEILASLKVFK